jgi:cysteine desulfurase
MIYLDWASTTPPEPGLLAEAAALAIGTYGNPSSRHALGGAARDRLEEARGRLAAVLAPTDPAGTRPATIEAFRGHRAPPSGAARLVFTSGGSEADALVLLSLLRKRAAHPGSPPPHIVTSSIEHSAVYEEAKLLQGLGIELSLVDPRADGRVDPADLAKALRKNTALVAVMALNNETGAIQPLAALLEAVRAASQALGRQAPPHFHTDAVQALGKLAFHPEELGVDSAAFSAHKLRGPRGVGALWLRGRLEPLAVGGGQEAGLRPGTENLMGAWAFSLAARAAKVSLEERLERAARLEARLLSGLASIPGALALPLGRRQADPAYSPFILSLAFPGLSGEVLERSLSDQGFAVSTGAACSSHSAKKGRRILDAMGLDPELSFSAIRVSTGETTTEAEIDAFLEAASASYRRLKT